MSFTAKLVATGEFFDAHTDLGPDQDRDLIANLPIQQQNFYRGRFYPGSYSLPQGPNNAECGRYSKFCEKILQGNELEPVLPPSALVGTRKVRKTKG